MSKPEFAAPAAAAPLFAALGDATRLALLAELADGAPRSIASLSAGAGMSRQAVTKHLAVLEAAGFAVRARTGRETRYAFRAGAVGEARSYLEAVSARWDARLERLRALVEVDGA